MQDFIFWWSVVSTILSVVFLGVSIWQVVDNRKQKERSNAQVKIWMQDANGVTQALARVIQDNLAGRYSSTNDVCNAIWAIHASSFALYQSLYEERAITEDEYKEQQKEFKEQLKKQQESQNQPQADTTPKPKRKRTSR
ncbi:MAG TPA: hypothetical protein VG935_03035 [Patescibacteria group bacterium]|nr:hypothetical protein [Patescibacteria group bacterium]